MKVYTRAYILIILILLQSLIAIATLQVWEINLWHLMEYEYSLAVSSSLILISGIASIWSIGNILNLLYTEKKANEKLNHSQEVITALQSQKHDFKNHLNVIAGMMQLDKGDHALEYIYNISEQVDSYFMISNLKNVELAAILYRKSAIAESEGIQVFVDINTSMEDLKVDSIDICKIIFNLLDNAIYALKTGGTEKRLLIVEMSETDQEYIISICNSYPVLPEALYDKIFEAGYSTKNGVGHGYGLSIVKQTIKKYKGIIKVTSNPEIGTEFTIYFPK